MHIGNRGVASRTLVTGTILLAVALCVAGTTAAKLSFYTKNGPVKVVVLDDIKSLGFAQATIAKLPTAAKPATSLQFVEGPGKCYFLIAGKPGNEYSLRLYSQSGAQLFSEQGTYEASGSQIVPVSKLEAGLYYVYHFDGEVSSTRTITTFAQDR